MTTKRKNKLTGGPNDPSIFDILHDEDLEDKILADIRDQRKKDRDSNSSSKYLDKQGVPPVASQQWVGGYVPREQRYYHPEGRHKGPRGGNFSVIGTEVDQHGSAIGQAAQPQPERTTDAAKEPGQMTREEFKATRVSQQQMLARGADGHLRSANEIQMPISRIEGLEPVPSPAEGGDYAPGKEITQPVEIRYERDLDQFTLYGGNHRVQQAKVNGDTTIPAFVEGLKYEDLKDISPQSQQAEDWPVAKNLPVVPLTDVVPATGKSITLQVHRGQGQVGSEGFSTDPGDLGSGMYYTTSESVAKSYGKVTSREMTLNNPLVLDASGAGDVVDKYGTVQSQGKTPEDKLAARVEGAKQLRKDVLDQGYDSILVNGWDSGKEHYTIIDFTGEIDGQSQSQQIEEIQREIDNLVDKGETKHDVQEKKTAELISNIWDKARAAEVTSDDILPALTVASDGWNDGDHQLGRTPVKVTARMTEGAASFVNHLFTRTPSGKFRIDRFGGSDPKKRLVTALQKYASLHTKLGTYIDGNQKKLDTWISNLGGKIGSPGSQRFVDRVKEKATVADKRLDLDSIEGSVSREQFENGSDVYFHAFLVPKGSGTEEMTDVELLPDLKTKGMFSGFHMGTRQAAKERTHTRAVVEKSAKQLGEREQLGVQMDLRSAITQGESGREDVSEDFVNEHFDVVYIPLHLKLDPNKTSLGTPQIPTRDKLLDAEFSPEDVIIPSAVKGLNVGVSYYVNQVEDPGSVSAAAFSRDQMQTFEEFTAEREGSSIIEKSALSKVLDSAFEDDYSEDLDDIKKSDDLPDLTTRRSNMKKTAEATEALSLITFVENLLEKSQLSSIFSKFLFLKEEWYYVRNHPAPSGVTPVQGPRKAWRWNATMARSAGLDDQQIAEHLGASRDASSKATADVKVTPQADVEREVDVTESGVNVEDFVSWKEWSRGFKKLNPDEVKLLVRQQEIIGMGNGKSGETKFSFGFIRVDKEGKVTGVTSADGQLVTVVETADKDGRITRANVRFSTVPDSHVQFTWERQDEGKTGSKSGWVDEVVREYSWEHKSSSTGRKFELLKAVAAKMPALRRVVKRDLTSSKRIVRETAFAVAMLDHTAKRVDAGEGTSTIKTNTVDKSATAKKIKEFKKKGGTKNGTGRWSWTQDSKGRIFRTISGKKNDQTAYVHKRVRTYGISSLRPEHITELKNGSVQLRFLGKDGKVNKNIIKDPFLKKELLARKKAPPGKNGELINTSYSSITKYMKNQTGLQDISPHDFRYFHATRLAGEAMEKLGSPKEINPTDFRRELMKINTDMVKLRGKGLSPDERVGASAIICKRLHEENLIATVGEYVAPYLAHEPKQSIKTYISPMAFEESGWSSIMGEQTYSLGAAAVKMRLTSPTPKKKTPKKKAAKRPAFRL